jgi:hypothetical protein
VRHNYNNTYPGNRKQAENIMFYKIGGIFLRELEQAKWLQSKKFKAEGKKHETHTVDGPTSFNSNMLWLDRNP